MMMLDSSMIQNMDDLVLIELLTFMLHSFSIVILLKIDPFDRFYQNIFYESDPSSEFMEISFPKIFDFL